VDDRVIVGVTDGETVKDWVGVLLGNDETDTVKLEDEDTVSTFVEEYVCVFECVQVGVIVGE
jgi:hypothetical protein